ncbi:MAG: rRNA maturation RNase YbeY [Rikenellaceae bacterium]
MAVTFSSTDIKFACKNKRILASFIKEMICSHAMKCGDISVVFCSDEKILEINRQYLKHDYYTDIITFDYSENGTLSGDLMISIDTVRSNAKEFGVDFLNELHRIIIHGTLHLIGLKDKQPKDQKIMRENENINLEKLSLILKDK